MLTPREQMPDERQRTGQEQWARDGDAPTSSLEPGTLASIPQMSPSTPQEYGHFVIVDAPGLAGRRCYEITDTSVLVGRSSRCDIVIPDDCVSLRHLLLRRERDVLYVEDLGSSNGSLLNGRRLGAAEPFPTGAELHIGQRILRHEHRPRREVLREAGLTAELDRARRYVQMQLPAPLTSGPLQTAWWYEPCEILGGDAFGYHALDDLRTAIYLLDVSGHGVGSAMLSVAALTTLRRQTLPGVDFADPAQVLKGLNQIFVMEEQGGMFITVWYGVLDLARQTLAFAAAGHPPALLTGRSDGRSQRLQANGPAIGIDRGAMYAAENVQIADGDRLYVFSDGTFEVRLRDGREWSFEDFQLEVLRNPERLRDEPSRVRNCIKQIAASPAMEDDLSLLIAEIRLS